MCILRLRLLNLRSPHSFSEIDRWENAVTGVLCVEKEELREDSFLRKFPPWCLLLVLCLLLQGSETNKTYYGFYINHQCAPWNGRYKHTSDDY